MNAHITGWVKTSDDAKAALAFEEYKATGVAPPGMVDDLAKLTVWQRTSTVLEPKSVSPTGAAILPKNSHKSKHLPRVDDWLQILDKIDWNKNGFVTFFLESVIHWHHQSTSGRFSDQLGRFERYGVQSVERWNCYTLKTTGKPAVSVRTFHRIKDRLIELGLIVAESHLWNGKTYLWIKPTDELSRIVFEPGYWSTVRAKFEHVPTKKKPRGVHVAKAKLAAPIPKNGISAECSLAHCV